MRGCLFLVCAALLSGLANGQQAVQERVEAQTIPAQPSAAPANPAPAKKDDSQKKEDTALKDLFASKIKVEWEALKNKDKKTYGDLLADDYQGVETDGQGERNKVQAIAEVSASNVANYTLWGLKVTPLDPNATFIVYESTIQFPPGSPLRFSRLYIGALWVKQAGEWKELHYQETHVK